MKLLNKRSYQKKDPFRDASLFVIICEGEKREPEYFNFFDKLNSKIKVITIPSIYGKSSPSHLIENADKSVVALEISDNNKDELWFVLDFDRWELSDLHNIRRECSSNGWNVAFSNPCFEVWLYYHFSNEKPNGNLRNSSFWKKIIPQIQSGGFDSTMHPSLISKAIKNAKDNYESEGYFPKEGATEVYLLAENIYKLVKDILKKYD